MYNTRHGTKRILLHMTRTFLRFALRLLETLRVRFYRTDTHRDTIPLKPRSSGGSTEALTLTRDPRSLSHLLREPHPPLRRAHAGEECTVKLSARA